MAQGSDDLSTLPLSDKRVMNFIVVSQLKLFLLSEIDHLHNYCLG